MNYRKNYDIIVIGAGTAGASFTIFMKESGLSILVLDKKRFPRDKPCGGGITWKSIEYLKRLNLIREIEKEGNKINNMIISSPDGNQLRLSTRSREYVFRREQFDNIIFKQAKKYASRIMEDFEVKEILTKNGYAIGVKGFDKKSNKSSEFYSKLIIGADGANSILRLNQQKIENKYMAVSLRVFYDNIKDISDTYEFHFIKDICPGYFWIFPVNKKTANIGIGVPKDLLVKRKLNLKKILLKTINQNPLFKHRFQNAKRVSDFVGWSLPMIAKKIQRSGNGYMLLGDAAGLVDPISGEGIQNALASAYYASFIAKHAFKKNNFSSKSFHKYNQIIEKKIVTELRVHYYVRILCSNKLLFNLLLRLLKKNKSIIDRIRHLLAFNASSFSDL